MPLFGPRLDRPSAIGDEGRPRATSLTVASLVVFGLLVVTGHLIGLLSFSLGVAGLTALVTIGLALLNRERFLAVFLGQLCYVLGGSGLVGLVGYTFVGSAFAGLAFVQSAAYALYFAGFGLALLGLSAAWADAGDRESTKTALIQGGLSYVTMLLWFAVVAIVAVVVLLVWGFLVQEAATAPPTPSLVAFALAASFSSVLVLAAIRWLPIRQLTPRDRREAVASHLRIARLAVAAVGGFAFVTAIGAVVVAAIAGPALAVVTRSPAGLLVSGLSSPFVLGPVLAVGVGAFLAVVLSFLLRRATRPVDARANRLLAGVVAGFAFTVLLLPFLFSYVPLPGALRIFGALLLVFLGPVTLFVVGGTLLVAVELDVLPDRAGGPALAAAGMVVATISAGLLGLPGPVVFACAAGAMIAWDVSAFGLGVTAELGHLPETRRLELFHAVVTVVFGAFVVAALSGLDLVRTSAMSGVVVLPAVLVAVVGALLLLVPVRG